MKLKFRREKGFWLSAICKGNGGVSSMVYSRVGSFWWALGAFFKFKMYKKALK